MFRAQRIGQAERGNLAISRARGGQGEGVFAPQLRLCGIGVLFNDVVIARHDKGDFLRQKLFRARVKPLHPCQFIVVFRAGGWVAIGQVEAAQAQGGATDHRRLDIAGLLVALVALQAASHILKREFGQDRDAVEAFLSMGFNAVAHILEDLARETFIHGFDLLQHRHIRGLRLQPCRKRFDAGFDAVDIERCDFHAGLLRLSPL